MHSYDHIPNRSSFITVVFLFLVEKSLGKINRLLACLCVRRVKRTLLIENIKLSFLLLSVGRMMVGGRRVECPPPPGGQRNTLPGSKNIFLKKLIFLLRMSKKGFPE